MNNYIEQALTNLRLNAARVARAERYYDGRHDLAFATEKFQNAFGSLFREFALNLCPVICDAVRDKLRVTGFSTEDMGTGGNATVMERASKASTLVNTRVSAFNAGSETRHIWNANRMHTRAGEVHKEALICGDAYMIVWPDDAGRAVLYPNRSANVTVVYHDDAPGRIRWAAKYWRTTDKFARLNLFYPDRIEKYISRQHVEGTLPDASDLVPLGERTTPPAKRDLPSFWHTKRASVVGDAHNDVRRGVSEVPNPYGIVPVFNLANNAELGQLGRSELTAAIPVQDGLNKAVLDMLVAMEFSAYRQRWAAGIEIEYDADGKPVAPFTAGIDHLWISENPNARFGDFEASMLDQFLKVKDSFRVDMAAVSGTPLDYFMQDSGGFPSGESLRKSETRFLAKVRDRQESFGQVWADVMAFALMIEGRGHDVSLITEWEDPAPVGERELLDNIILKKQIGLPVEQALLEAGYGEADVKKMTATENTETMSQNRER